MRSAIVLVLASGCSFDHGKLPSGGSDDPPPDAAIDTPPASTWPTTPFGMPELVTLSSATYRDDDITLTSDMLEIFWESDRLGDSDIFTARRDSLDAAWSLPALVEEVSTPHHETSVEISPNGLVMYFGSNRPPSTTTDVFVSTRPDRGSPWSAPVLVSELSGGSGDYDAQPWSDTVLYLGSNRPPSGGGGDIFRSTRPAFGMPWGVPAVVPGLDTADYEGEAFADAKGAIWFTGNHTGTLGVTDIWRADQNGDGSYAKAVQVTELATMANENDAWLSPDGRTLYFTSDRTGNGTLDIYVARR